MKKAFKKNILKLFIFLSFNFANVCFATDENDNFNFIKSGENVKEFIYDGTLLLYGGIALIIISILGMIFTCVPKKVKAKRYNKNKL